MSEVGGLPVPRQISSVSCLADMRMCILSKELLSIDSRSQKLHSYFALARRAFRRLMFYVLVAGSGVEPT
jgi:hypothetical protein